MPEAPAGAWEKAVRGAPWLNAGRVRAACLILVVMLAGLLASIPWTVPDMQLGWDFAAFWTAARLALGGDAAAAYGEAARAALTALLGPHAFPPFFYPPQALLLWAPFGALPFPLAAGLWVAGSLAAWLAAMRAAFGRGVVLPALAFPAVVVCGLYGQNAFFSAALLAGALATLERRPALAGALLGVLAYKPQIAFLVPFALLAAGRWRALIVAALVFFVLADLSALAFGLAPWAAFFGALDAAQAWNGAGRPGFDKFVSLYAAVRLLGGGAALASGAQAALGLVVTGGLLVLARRRPGGDAEVAALVAATALAVPFLGDYDLVLLAVPGAWIACEAGRTGWLAYERIGLAVLFWTPLAIKPASVHGLPLGPVALLGLAALVGRRAWARGTPRFRRL